MSRLLYLIYPSTSLWDSPSKQSSKLASSTTKMAKSYFEEVGDDVNMKSSNLSSTLDKLHAWEKKLYKEVKVNSFSFVFLSIAAGIVHASVCELFYYVLLILVH